MATTSPSDLDGVQDPEEVLCSLVESGLVDVIEVEGERRYRLTEAGSAEVEKLRKREHRFFEPEHGGEA